MLWQWCTYPPSVEDCPKGCYTFKKRHLLFANHITDNWFSLSSSVGSYLLQGPEGVHHWPDFLLSIETQEFVHHRSHQATFPVPEKEIEEREPCYDFVLFVEFNGVHLLHLPPLEREREGESKKHHPKLQLWAPFLCNEMFILVTRSRQTASLTHRFCKAEETLCFPSDHVWRAWKNRNKGMVGRCGLRGRRDWTVISSHEGRKLGRNSLHLIKTGQEITPLTSEMKSLSQHFWRNISVCYSQLNIKNQTNNRAVR